MARADALLRHADKPWIDCATRAVRELAGRGQDFTADDVTALVRAVQLARLWAGCWAGT